MGDMKLELFCENCPKSCENFLALCASDYYNGCLFHRNIKGFMIQTGDPSGLAFLTNWLLKFIIFSSKKRLIGVSRALVHKIRTFAGSSLIYFTCIGVVPPWQFAPQAKRIKNIHFCCRSYPVWTPWHQCVGNYAVKENTPTKAAVVPQD